MFYKYGCRKPVLLLVFAFLGFISSVQSQTDSVKPFRKKGSWAKNHVLISFGIGSQGSDPFLYYDKSDRMEAVQSHSPTGISTSAYHFKIEFATKDHIGIAVCLNKSQLGFCSTYSFTPYNSQRPEMATEHLTLNGFSCNIRINYHFLAGCIIDPYIGVGAGMRVIYTTASVQVFNLNPLHYPVGFEATVGLRILAASRVGLYAEAGLGRSLLQAGISINIGRNRFRRTLF